MTQLQHPLGCTEHTRSVAICLMLQQLRWRIRPLHSHILRHVSTTRSRQQLDDHVSRRLSHNLNFHPFRDESPDNHASTVRKGTSVPSEKDEISPSSTPVPRFNRNTRRSEPYLNIGCLSESLEAHRDANRIGLARDGRPRRPLRPERRKQIHPQDSLQVEGMKHLDITTTPGPRTRRQISSYGGMCPKLSSDWLPSASLPYRLRFPWVSDQNQLEVNTTSRSAQEQLGIEIRAVDAYFSPTHQEIAAGVQVFNEIKSIMSVNLGADTKVDLIGSRASGTYGPTSDLDINLVSPLSLDTPEGLKMARDRLHGLLNEMRRYHHRDILLIHNFVRAAQVPIIVGTHLPSGLEFQVQSSNTSYDSLEVTRAYIAEYPTARILFKLLKQMLTLRGLNLGHTGGLTSYPLLNMIVASLKLRRSHMEPDDVALQLLQFLDFWSEISFMEQKIEMTSPLLDRPYPHNHRSVDPISAIPRIVKHDKDVSRHEYLMSFEDPANIENNLGRSASQIKHIQACFIEARESLRSSMKKWASGPHPTDVNSKIAPLLAWCLEGDYSSVEESRQQLRKYAELQNKQQRYFYDGES